MSQIYTIIIEQMCQFSGGGGCPEKIKLNKIHNFRHAAIIDFNMRNIWRTVPDILTITIEQNVGSGKYMP